jgi:hypothetical protein
MQWRQSQGEFIAARKRRRKPRRRRRAKRPEVVEKVLKPAPPASKPEPPPTPTAKTVADSKRPGIAVMNVQSVHGLPDGVASLVNEMILVRLKNTDRFASVIGGSDMAAMIDLEAQKQALGCSEDSCLAELGGALGVPFMLTASIGKMGSLIVLTLKIIAVEEARVMVRKMLRAKNEEALAEGIDTLVDAAVVDLLGAAEPTAAQAIAKAAAPAIRAPPKATSSNATIKWSALGLGLVGAGFSGWRWAQWDAAQKAFTGRGHNVTTNDLAALGDETDAANQQVTGGLMISGIGLAVAWWAW